MTLGIAGIGTYVPPFRVETDTIEEELGRVHASGISETAVLDADEDAVTMAYEAVRNALDSCGRRETEVDFLAFATTTPPMAEEDQSVRLGEMCGVPAGATRQVFTGSARAGSQALLAALSAETDGIGVVVASDCPRGAPDSREGHASGGGAAALVLSPEEGASVEEVAQFASEYPGTRFRPADDEHVDGLDITTYDRNAFTDVTVSAVEQLETAPGTTDAVVIRSPDGDLPYRTGAQLGVDSSHLAEYASVHDIGDTGAANVFLDLSRAIEGGESSVLLVSYGSGGGADALVIDSADRVSVSRDEPVEHHLSYADYLKLTGSITRETPEGGGAAVTLPTWRRSLSRRYRLEGGRCLACGAVTFVPDGACPSCNEAAGFETTRLDPIGTVETVTTISEGGAPPEFVAYQAKAGDFPVAIVAFEAPDGATGSIPLQIVTRDPASIDVGDEVEATIRRIYTQEDVTRYGIKGRPVSK